MMMHTYNPRTWEAETRESDVKATVSQLNSKFKANLEYMKLSKKKKPLKIPQQSLR